MLGGCVAPAACTCLLLTIDQVFKKPRPDEGPLRRRVWKTDSFVLPPQPHSCSLTIGTS